MVTFSEPWLPELFGPAEKQATFPLVNRTREAVTTCVETGENSEVVFQVPSPPMEVVPFGSQN